MAEGSHGMREWSEGVLEHYFKMLSAFAHDQSKELAEKEKAAQVHSAGSATAPPSPSPPSASGRVAFLNVLCQLSLAEKAYHSMYFFVAKGFLRKDSSLRSSFEGIMSELVSLKESARKLNSSGSGHLLCHLCDQVGQYVNARIVMIDFYERLGMSRPDTAFVFWPEFLENLRAICEKHHKLFHHPLLGPIKSAFDFETEALVNLIEAQVHLEEYRFLPSLLSLNEASTKLDSWEALGHGCDEYRASSKYGLSAMMSLTGRSPPERALFRWISGLKASLVSKFSYYFYNVLAAQTNHHAERMKVLCSKLSCDYYQKVATFHRRTDAMAIILAFDACGTPVHEGYRFPLRFPARVSGLDSVPAISCYPPKPVGQAHWPSIVMLISDPVKACAAITQPVMFYDAKFDFTYFFMKAEPKMTLVLLFRGRRSEKDSAVVSFMMEMTSNLRSSKLLLSLCPRSK